MASLVRLQGWVEACILVAVSNRIGSRVVVGTRLEVERHMLEVMVRRAHLQLPGRHKLGERNLAALRMGFVVRCKEA